MILYEEGVYRVNPSIQVYTDVQDLKDWVSKSVARPTAVLTYSQIADLVVGEFLPKLDSLWADEQRRSLRGLQLEFLSHYADLQQRSGNPRAALRSFELLRQHDIYLESAWCGVMESLARLGERAKLVVLYRELCDLFDKELGVSPSKETRDLYDRLVFEDDCA